MARIGTRHAEIILVVEEIVFQIIFMLSMIYWRRNMNRRGRYDNRVVRYRMADRILHQIQHMTDLIGVSDVECFNNLRVNRDIFTRLCFLLRNAGGLVDKRYVSVAEQVAMFLSDLSRHTKMRVIKFQFKRSTQTINKHFHIVLNAVLKLHRMLLATPIPIDDDCTDYKWKPFKGCLGALDGTYIDITVPETIKARYRTRKGTISVNVLAVCDTNMRFVYMLTGWEGSTADARILRDALTKPNGFKVSQGSYYLCDNGYANADDFLTPYKMVRYHLSEWGHGPATPQNYKEYYNMKNTKARNVIERTFGLMMKRWTILRSPSFYPIGTQNRIILACGLIHNFIRNEMPDDPLDDELAAVELNQDEADLGEFIDVVQPSPEWSTWRETLAQHMYADWLGAACHDPNLKPLTI